jgi:hypothetical protein
MKILITIVTLYVILFVVLVIAALRTQNVFLLTCIPIMARELVQVFRRICVRSLFASFTTYVISGL